MRLVFWLLVVGYVVAWGWAAVVLPARVPLHFDVAGRPDNWGGKTELLVVMACLGGGIAILFGALARYAERLPLRASWVNLPHKQWWTATPEREARARRMLSADLHALSALVMTLPLVVLLFTVHAARQPAPEMHPLALILVCALVLLVICWSAWLTLARYRPPEDE